MAKIDKQDMKITTYEFVPDEEKGFTKMTTPELFTYGLECVTVVQVHSFLPSLKYLENKYIARVDSDKLRIRLGNIARYLLERVQRERMSFDKEAFKKSYLAGAFRYFESHPLTYISCGGYKGLFQVGQIHPNHMVDGVLQHGNLVAV